MSIDWWMIALTAIFICFDFFTGIVKAIYNKNLSSQIMRVGILHKASFAMLIALAILCEYAMQYMDLGFTLPMLAPVCVYLCLTELISILENIAAINPALKNTKVLEFFESTKKVG